MRLGLSTSLSGAQPKDWARTLADAGCGCAVFPVDSYADDALIAAYLDAARESGLVIAEVGVWRNLISPNRETREAALAFAKAQLRLADEIGANCCVNIAGAAGTVWDGAYRENFSREIWDATVRSAREIIDAVKPANTYYTLEPMPWMIPSDPDEYLRLIQAVDRERFAVHMDLCNWITSPRKFFFSGEFAAECFAKLGSFIKSCHLKDVALRSEFTLQLVETNCGGGNIDLEAYAAAASAQNPDMPMIIEHLKSDDDYFASLSYVRERFGAAGLV